VCRGESGAVDQRPKPGRRLKPRRRGFHHAMTEFGEWGVDTVIVVGEAECGLAAPTGE